MTSRYIDPWGTFEIDDATGLPQVPEGMFWRVKKQTSLHWRVELREEKFFSSRLVSYATSRYDIAPVSKENILSSAAFALTEYRRTSHGDMSLLGYYPPKKV